MTARPDDRRSPRPTPTPTPAPANPAGKRCNGPDCTEDPTHRGLCPVHWDTHRGLADEPTQYSPDPIQTREAGNPTETR
jgi:hypothetical protein